MTASSISYSRMIVIRFIHPTIRSVPLLRTCKHIQPPQRQPFSSFFFRTTELRNPAATNPTHTSLRWVLSIYGLLRRPARTLSLRAWLIVSSIIRLHRINVLAILSFGIRLRTASLLIRHAVRDSGQAVKRRDFGRYTARTDMLIPDL